MGSGFNKDADRCQLANYLIICFYECEGQLVLLHLHTRAFRVRCLVHVDALKFMIANIHDDDFIILVLESYCLAYTKGVLRMKS